MSSNELKASSRKLTNSAKVNFSLSADDVCRILLGCGKAKVAELQFGPLFVRFGAPADDDVPRGTMKSERLPPAAAKEIAETQHIVAEKSFDEQEIEVKQEQLAQMLLEDPVRAEELLLRGDLEESLNGDRTEEA